MIQTPNLCGYRKFFIALTSVLSASLLVAMQCISDGVYSTVMLAVVGGYLAANVTQKVAK